ncbi:hypothetical protein J4Q44_G00230300, partial [Coregonus suidteri]
RSVSVCVPCASCREDTAIFLNEFHGFIHFLHSDSVHTIKMNYMPGTASLIDDIDKKHLVLLRDGRTLIGFLRSIDQFANLVFHQTVERIHVGKKFGDIPRGIFIVRGENVVLLGEIDMDKPCDTVLQQVSIEEILEEQRLQQQAKQETEKAKVSALKDRGLSIPKADNLDEY